jgi:hypothetical protein
MTFFDSGSGSEIQSETKADSSSISDVVSSDNKNLASSFSMGGGRRRRKSVKKSKKVRKSRKSRKSKKSRKLRKPKKSRKSRK